MQAVTKVKLSSPEKHECECRDGMRRDLRAKATSGRRNPNSQLNSPGSKCTACIQGQRWNPGDPINVETEFEREIANPKDEELSHSLAGSQMGP